MHRMFIILHSSFIIRTAHGSAVLPDAAPLPTAIVNYPGDL